MATLNSLTLTLWTETNPFRPACLEGVCTLDPWDRMSVGLANSCPCPHNPAPIQAREVVSDLSAVQTPPPQSARIRRMALAPVPLA